MRESFPWRLRLAEGAKKQLPWGAPSLAVSSPPRFQRCSCCRPCSASFKRVHPSHRRRSILKTRIVLSSRRRSTHENRYRCPSTFAFRLWLQRKSKSRRRQTGGNGCADSGSCACCLAETRNGVHIASATGPLRDRGYLSKSYRLHGHDSRGSRVSRTQG